MKWLFCVTVVLLTGSWSAAQEAKRVPREILDRIVDDDPNPLPRYLTPAERLLPLPTPELRVLPPSGVVRTPSEYEFNEGLLIRWGSYNALLTELAVGVTTADPQAVVYILVTGSSQQSSATSTLTAAGAEMDQVEFIIYASNTVWIRDYGPRFMFEDQARAIVDHTYNRPRPLDDAFSSHLSSLWGEPEYDLPLVHGGGNFHLFSNGEAFMSDLILLENSSLTEQDVKDYVHDYLNLDLTIYEGFPWNVDGTKHIDMWMMPLGDDEVIIGEYSEGPGYPPTEITDSATADLTARGYTVYRTPGWNSGSGGTGGTHYTYTNAVILNNVVLIPEFGGLYAVEDAQAKAVFQTALPDHQIIQTDCSDIIHAAGAIHCIVMHVPGHATTLRVTPGGGLAASGPAGGPFSPDSVVYTLENSSDIPMQYQVTHAAPWLSITNASGMIPELSTAQVTVSINAAADTLGVGIYGDTVQFVDLTNHDGDTSRAVELVVGVPERVYAFDMDASPGWSTSGQWAHGQVTGQGGTSYGYPDPASGATGANVCGVNLDGDYSTTPGGPHYLTTAAMDCSDLIQVSLRFRRWLNTDYQPYAYATVEVSNDGTDWMSMWQNGASEITENTWSAQVYDISAVADHASTLYVRWGYQVESSAYAYSGWNLDDIEIWAIAPGPHCDDTADCVDLDGDGIRDDNCVWQVCDAGDCISSDIVFADMGAQFGACTPDGVADAHDRFHALNCFANTTTGGVTGYPCEAAPPQAYNVDAGGAFGSCACDGVCDGNDAFHVLNAFDGTTTCSCPGRPAPRGPGESPVVAEAGLQLVADRAALRPGDHVDVDIYLTDGMDDLRGYQLHLGVTDGARGTLELVDIVVHDSKDHVFTGLAYWSAFNIHTAQMVAGLDSAGVRAAAGTYLATFTYRVGDGATGRFSVDLLYDRHDLQHRTFLFPTPATGVIEIEADTTVTIDVHRPGVKRGI